MSNRLPFINIQGADKAPDFTICPVCKERFKLGDLVQTYVADVDIKMNLVRLKFKHEGCERKEE